MRPIRAQERASFTAMGPLADQAPSIYAGWKRYVYRGTGEDQHPTWDLEYEEPNPRPKRTAEQRRRLNEARRAKADVLRRMREHAARVRRYTLPESEPVVFDQPEYPPLKLVWSQAEIAEAEDAEPFTVKRVPDKPRPSPGWKPVTGEDIDHMLGDE